MNDQRQIVAFMAFAVAFGVIGHTMKSKTSGGTTAGADVKIILAGAVGTVLLVLLSEAGQGGETFAKGLAALTLISSVLVNGSPLFSDISKEFSSAGKTPQLITTPKG